MSDENDVIADDGEEIKEDSGLEEGELEESEVEKKKSKKTDDVEDWDKLPNEGTEEENELDKENW